MVLNWKKTVQKLNGSLPVPLCKYWGELMGMAGGHVRPPLIELSDEEKDELKRELALVQQLAPSGVGETA